MERTRKVKITLGITLCLLVLAFLLRFFPVQEELAAYAPDAAASRSWRASNKCSSICSTLCFDAVEIEYCMTYSPANERPLNFYFLRTADGTESLLVDTQAYINEAFPEPVRFTGYASLPLGGAAEQLLPRCSFAESALARFGDAQAVLREVSQTVAMRLNKHAGEHASVAFVCVSAAAMLSFCVFLAMLLKEYFGGKRRKPKGDE